MTIESLPVRHQNPLGVTDSTSRVVEPSRHVAHLGMEHVYIKPRTPQLNGKVERSHRTDKDEFYQLLTYRGDVNLEKKLDVRRDL